MTDDELKKLADAPMMPSRATLRAIIDEALSRGARIAELHDREPEAATGGHRLMKRGLMYRTMAWLTGTEHPPGWEDHPEQVRWRRGFAHGAWFGVQAVLTVEFLVWVWVTAR